MSTEKKSEAEERRENAERIREAEQALPREATAFGNPPQPSVNPPPKAPESDDEKQ